MKPLSAAATLAFSIAAALGSASANAAVANISWNERLETFYIYDIALSANIVSPTHYDSFGWLARTDSGGGYAYTLQTEILSDIFTRALADTATDLGVDQELLRHPIYGIFDLDRSWVSYSGTDGTEYLTLAQIRTNGGDFLLDNYRINMTLSWTAGYEITGIHFEYLNPVPEPETWAMLLAGLGIVGATARRRKS